MSNKDVSFDEQANACVEVYISRSCVYCVRVISLLDSKDVNYVVHVVDGDAEVRQKMKERVQGRHTVPQIFVNNEPIGGFYDLLQLEQSGELDALLFQLAD